MSPEDRHTLENAIAFARSHKKAIAEELTDVAIFVPEEAPVSVFMAGSPGAGKTEASLELLAQYGGQVLRIDPDELRDRLPGYCGNNAGLFQGPVSILVDRILDRAFKQSQTFLLDGTLSNYQAAAHNIERSLRRRRVVQILYVYQEPEQAWEFVQAREALDGRHIPPEQFIQQYFEARRVVNALKKTFGQNIHVDLLIKNIDGTTKIYRDNIEQIDSYVPERYDVSDLHKMLGIT